MRAFVTGSTGFLGRTLVQELLACGWEVSALVRTFERARQLPAGVRAVPGDITQPDSLRPGLRGAGAVFHLAAWTQIGVPPREQARMQRINVEGARHVLTLAAEAGAERILHVSDVAVFGDQRAPNGRPPAGAAGGFESYYQTTRAAAHFEVAAGLQRQGAPVIIAALGALYGPGDLAGLGRLLRQQLRRRLPVLLGPDNARSWTYAADAAQGLRLAVERGRPGETYALAGPAHTLRAVLEAAARLSRAPAPLIWLPSAAARSLARLAGRVRPALAERLRAAGGAAYLADPAAAQAALGWSARPLAEGLPPTLAWLEEHAP
ncbi:MAG: NAD-dependent epimerase/dehydratase family protein [Anaerolineales bacterium]|nr:NAD-dependent epimerase/dehydratase family protein [Anaerolineales bacterium]